jgi:superoxide reductase
MNNRREFLIKGSATMVSLLAMGTVKPAQATEKSFTGIVYTKENPGKWRKKVGSHLPSIHIENGRVNLSTKHPMSARHYIIRHTLVLEDGTVVGAKTFYPDTEKATSDHTLPAGYKGKIYATSFCNLHDFWVNEATV